MSFEAFVGHGLVHGAQNALHPVTHSLSLLGNSVFPLELPDTNTLIDLFLRGWIDKYTLDKFARLNGVYLDLSGQLSPPPGSSGNNKVEQLWEQVVYAKQELPTVGEMFELTNRGLWPAEKLGYNLSLLGYWDPKVQDTLAQLRFDIPSSSDLVRFSVRHVFEPDLIKYLGYNDEFNPYLDFWHKMQGLNYPIRGGPFEVAWKNWYEQLPPELKEKIKPYERYQMEPPTWAQAFWWSHWVLPSPSQGYEMLFRLREQRDRRFDPPGAEKLQFSRSDLDLLLRANDYPPFYRPALAAIAHRLPGIRFLRQLVHTGVFSGAEVADLLQSQGYSPGHAAVLTESVLRNEREQKRREIERQAKGQINRYWEIGILSHRDYFDLLVKHGLSPQDAQEAVDLGDVDRRAKRAERSIKFVHRQYTKGKVNSDEARLLLDQIGIVEPQLSDYLTDWKLEVQSEHKEISAARAVHWACRGIIGLIDLRQRLENLGYGGADIAGLSEEAAQCALERSARAAAAAGRAEKARAKDLIAAQRAAARQVQSARRALSAHGSPAQLRKWFCENLIGAPEVYARLTFLGWPDADISRLIGDCKAARGSGGLGKGGPRSPTRAPTGPGTTPAGGAPG